MKRGSIQIEGFKHSARFLGWQSGSFVVSVGFVHVAKFSANTHRYMLHRDWTTLSRRGKGKQKHGFF